MEYYSYSGRIGANKEQSGGEVVFEIKKFGAFISRLRKERDYTQSELADLLNVTRQSVSKWELGDSFPDISLLTKLSEIFCVS